MGVPRGTRGGRREWRVGYAPRQEAGARGARVEKDRTVQRSPVWRLRAPAPPPKLRSSRRAGRLTVALAVSTSASWLMLDTSGELFMMTRIRDRGSDTSRCSPHLSLPTATSAIFSLPRDLAAGGRSPCSPVGVVVRKGGPP